MLIKVISGGQSGADLAGWRAARRFSIPTGGLMPEGFLTETPDGRSMEAHPEFRELYAAEEVKDCGGRNPAATLRMRSYLNVRHSDATLCFDETNSRATGNADADCRRLGRPFRCVMLDRAPDGSIRAGVAAHRPHNIAEWIKEHKIEWLNVCGNRESKAPGIGAWVEAYLAEVFRLLGHEEATPARLGAADEEEAQRLYRELLEDIARGDPWGEDPGR